MVEYLLIIEEREGAARQMARGERSRRSFKLARNTRARIQQQYEISQSA
jgi:hypothetical protein